jgi:hypothetical protein
MKKIFLCFILIFNSTATLSAENKYCESDCTYELNMFKKYTRKDSSLAEYMLGIMLTTGQGTDKNTEAGVRHINKAALKKEPSAEFQLGYLYLYGVYIEPDLEKAEVFLTRAKKSGVLQANKHLNRIHEIRNKQFKKKETLSVNKVLEEKGTKNKNKPIIKMEVIRVFAGLNYSDIIYAAEQQTCKNAWGKMNCQPFSNSAFVPFLTVNKQEEKALESYL